MKYAKIEELAKGTIELKGVTITTFVYRVEEEGQICDKHGILHDRHLDWVEKGEVLVGTSLFYDGLGEETGPVEAYPVEEEPATPRLDLVVDQEMGVVRMLGNDPYTVIAHCPELLETGWCVREEDGDLAPHLVHTYPSAELITETMAELEYGFQPEELPTMETVEEALLAVQAYWASKR